MVTCLNGENFANYREVTFCVFLYEVAKGNGM